MANKIVKIGNSDQKQSQSNDIIYQDISMTSSLNGRTKLVDVDVTRSGSVLVQDDNPLAYDDHQDFNIDYSLTEKMLCGDYRRISKSINVRAVQNSLDNIFTWIPGERILNPEFGSRLHEYLYEGITQYNEEMIVAEIKSSIQTWEPRVVVSQVINRTNESDRDDNSIVLDIKYYIKDLPDQVFDKQYIFNRSI